MLGNADRLGESFTFLITVDILLATAISLFANKEVFITDKYQIVIAEFYAIPILISITAFVCFQISGNKISSIQTYRIHKWVLVGLVLSAAVLFGSIMPNNAIGGWITILTVSFGISFKIATSLLILAPSFIAIFRKVDKSQSQRERKR